MPPRLLWATIKRDDNEKQRAATLRPTLFENNLNITLLPPLASWPGANQVFLGSYCAETSRATEQRSLGFCSCGLASKAQSRGLIKVFLGRGLRFAIQNAEKREI